MTAQPQWSDGTGSEAVSSSASKVLVLLTQLLRSGTSAVTLGEVALAAALPKSTTHRLLKVLEEQGFVSRVGSRYRLSDRFVDLSEQAQWSAFGELRDASSRPLADLFQRTGAVAVHLAVLRGGSIVYVDKLMGAEGARLPTRVGGRFPATCTGLGKAMLAFAPAESLEEVLREPLARVTPHSVIARGRLVDQLRRTRAVGFAVESEEACRGTVCVAAPIVVDEQVVAALSISVASIGVRRSSGNHLAELGRLAATGADAIGAALASRATAVVPVVGTRHSAGVGGRA